MLPILVAIRLIRPLEGTILCRLSDPRLSYLAYVARPSSACVLLSRGPSLVVAFDAMLGHRRRNIDLVNRTLIFSS